MAASRNAFAVPAGPRRVSFARIQEPLEVPDLLALQTESFDWLLGNEKWQGRVEAARQAGRKDVPTQSGLEEIFEEISPIEDFSGTMSLSFRDHRFEPPKNSIDECKERDLTYSAPLFVTAEFINNDTGEIKSQTVFMGDFPLMTGKGTFVINGTERVVVSQLVRSPGRLLRRRSTRPPTRTSTAARSSPPGAPGSSSRSTSATWSVSASTASASSPSPCCSRRSAGPSAQILEEFGQYESMRPPWRRTTPPARTTPCSTSTASCARASRRPREAAQTLLDNLYFNPKRYDLAKVGRYKINKKLGRRQRDHPGHADRGRHRRHHRVHRRAARRRDRDARRRTASSSSRSTTSTTSATGVCVRSAS